MNNKALLVLVTAVVVLMAADKLRTLPGVSMLPVL